MHRGCMRLTFNGAINLATKPSLNALKTDKMLQMP